MSNTFPPDSASLALAIPAYNEADGIVEFLTELDAELKRWQGPVRMVVFDDASTDATAQVLEELAPTLHSSLEVHRNAHNSGHGPTVTRAYRRALDSGADFVLQVDGDGQFLGSDVWLLVDALEAGADVAVGVRRFRTDPWFRRALSFGLRGYLRILFGVSSADANCPFRLYRRDALQALMARLPDAPLIPTIYLTVLERRLGYRVASVPVTHRVRRGARTQGSTWGRRQRQVLIPKRLVMFVLQAIKESLVFAVRLRVSSS